ncbi:Tad domain-containing protein [Sphingobium algorifonticola]|uniref:Pilus assembly protein TadG n=1 Tax=Sphingobium algorifonticola TaxID=2008318 RepID=A0A437JBG6_9SPHN|nr:Tad domain-containing protein [Sphingobium algorifonticola]RVT43120.1 pilus assembly protein TadG [Sphingobium algorifonticola]
MGKSRGNTTDFRRDTPGGVLGSLLRNTRGNVLPMVAAGMFPMLGLIGGGVDMSRIYLTKSRLQQACDAGALAGRKMMAGGSWTANSNAANTAARAMFDANFVDGAYGTTGRTRTFTENAGTVTGTTSVTVPMALMKLFGVTSRQLTVTCQAEMRIPNSDVMFVLDNTGSMAQCASGNSCGSDTKIVGLRAAVKCFYEALAKIDTDEDCGSVPTTANGSDVQLRFGFVPYAVNVNVGRLLQNNWMVDEHLYQSRVPVLKATASLVATSNGSYGSWSGYTTYGTYTDVDSQDDCDDLANSFDANLDNGTEGAPFNQKYTGRSDAFPTDTLVDFDVNMPMRQRDAKRQSYSSSTDTCVVESRTRNFTQRRTYTYFDYYTYRPVTLNVSALKTGGSTWANSISLPRDTRGVYASTTWTGCIEERQAHVADSDPSNDYNPIPATAFDMDIDMIPTSDPATQWKPQLQDVQWGRFDGSGNTVANVDTAGNLARNYTGPNCPVAARRLQEYLSATDYEDYVDSMTPAGNTYHDIGLIWGARLLSPTGLFAADNATTPEGGEIQRHLIFMTDGDTVTDNRNVSPYGIAWWDRRQSNSASAPSNALLTSNVNARMQALCTNVKNRNITLWVISFGSGVSNAAQTALQNCASPGRFYSAADSAQLIDQFRQIADNISQLRLTN